VYFCIACGIATIFGPNVVAISARNTKVYKICELCKAIFSAFYNISQSNFAILLILVSSFREYTFLPCKIKKLVYNGNCLYCCHMNRIRKIFITVKVFRFLCFVRFHFRVFLETVTATTSENSSVSPVLVA
jgi:hypothetical protein